MVGIGLKFVNTPAQWQDFLPVSGISITSRRQTLLIDFFMIAKSQKVYFLHVKPMYNSSFSKYAAIIGNTKFEALQA